jgi:hypothetical protein
MDMKELRVFLFAASAVAQLFAQGNTPQAPQRHSATSFLEFKSMDGKEHTVINNQRFSVSYRCLTYRVSECSDIVFHESFYSDQEEDMEGARADVTVTAWLKKTANIALWKLKAPGDEGKVLEEFYEITQFGCCGGWDEKTYFALGTGKKIYTSSQNGLLKIAVPNTPTKRYIAFSSHQVAGKWIGWIQFGDENHVMQTLTLIQPGFSEPPEIGLQLEGRTEAQSVELWARNGDSSPNAVSGVNVTLKFDESTVVVPIQNDRLASNQVKTPKGYSVKE